MIQYLRVEDLGHGNLLYVFESNQVDIWGLPHLYGYQDYIVVESRCYEGQFVTDFKQEQEMFGNARPIHRYCRYERFRGIVKELLGMKPVPDQVIDACYELNPWEENLWNKIRAILKKNGWRRFYNRIPWIINELGLNIYVDVNINELFDYMMKKFLIMQEKFKLYYEEKYFPNLRFIALKLILEKVDVLIDLPLLQTKRKILSLEIIWNKIC